ncbi:MAG TPA: GNAT family N-acetyltransferase [Thermomicrobiales bacterium]|nr:GNAT family N-acetyltransferase [Thermomicrobiales bacterium]
MSDDHVLRRSQASDAPAIHRIRAHPVTRRYQPLEQRSVEDLRLILDERGHAEVTPWQNGKLEWTVVVNGDVAGWVTVSVTSRSHHIGTIGYSIAPRFQARGIATRAVRDVAATALDPSGLALERLEAVAAVENIASRRVLEKCGFAFEGIARSYLIISGARIDHARYARLHTDVQGDDRTRDDGAPHAHA